jgi:hypothetical protein
MLLFIVYIYMYLDVLYIMDIGDIPPLVFYAPNISFRITSRIKPGTPRVPTINAV